MALLAVMTDTPEAANQEPALWRTTHRVVVLDCMGGRAPRALVRRTPGGWGLSVWTVEEVREHDIDQPAFLAEARERLGMEATVLRYVDPSEDEDRRERSGTWILERRGGGAAPMRDGERWVERAEVGSVLEEEGETRTLLETTLAELESGAAPRGRCAWSQPGWFAQAEAWMVGQLEALGRPALGAIEQRKNNSISSVMRARTAAGYVYLKAASRHFRYEARITTGLASRFADHVPVVLASDVERSWLVMEDFGEVIRRKGVGEWERALALMGEMQRACIGESDWLRSIGCADRRLAALSEQIPALLDAPETRAELDEEVHRRLVRRTPELRAACDALAECGVPETLIHGDLHPGNVAVSDGRLTVFDWTDAAVGHPFVDLATFLPGGFRTPVSVENAAKAQRLLDVYLEGWTAVAPAAQLRRAAQLVETVARLHHAQSYLEILRSIERADSWQWAGELGEWLAPLDQGIPATPAGATAA